ncbi:MAG: sufurtransferase FdhD [Methanobacteriota archaeon]|nr:MAG: sufurtransferase FdhD [Euryarchaeota archaeon]
MDFMRDVEYTRIDLDKGRERRRGKVVVDGVVTVKVNDRPPFKMTVLPQDMEDAAIGRLFFMGLIGSVDDVIDIKRRGSSVELRIKEREMKLSKIGSDLRVEAGVLALCMKRLFASTEVWELTGGVHSAGLFDKEGRLIRAADDIGKGNAIDKVVGWGLREKVDFSGTILASTGRQIGFMVEKAVRAGIPIVVSRGAPLASSIDVADRYGVTLVCFAKGRRMNVYTCEHRVL